MESKKVEWQLVILVCSIIIIMIMGVRQSLGLFLEPITNFMNSGKEFFSFAIGVQAIIWGLVTFFLGILIDKFGPQKMPDAKQIIPNASPFRGPNLSIKIPKKKVTRPQIIA